MKKARLIAFYLPQFHPTLENDEWWGKGFTEWTNVTKAKPLFPGHYQPRLPADLGFYDLRLPETRAAQADLARHAGVEGFCYWHYWFAGRRILDRPFREVLESGKPDYPFCLAWANDSWTSHWYGADRRMLIEQTYPGPDDYERHFLALLPAFQDPRYIRVHDKPVFTIFRPMKIPDTQEFIAQWQSLAQQNGLKGIHFVAHLFDKETDSFPWKARGYDGAVITNELKIMRLRISQAFGKLLRASGPVAATMSTSRLIAHRVMQKLFGWPGSVYSYRDAKLFFTPKTGQGSYPSIVPGWDNTARAGPNGVVLHGSTPELFEEHVREILDSVSQCPSEERLVFVKSWNEWAEGNYLEPDRRFGHRYLDALRSALHPGKDSANVPATADNNPGTPSISIIICTRNRATNLKGTLAQMAQVHIPAGWNVELLLIDNGSTDSTKTIFQEANLARLSARYIPEAQTGQSYARNRGIQEAKGEILLWTDDDVRVPADWIAGMCRPILENRADAVAGGVIFPSQYDNVLTQLPHPNLRSWFASTEQLNREKPERMVGANMAFHRRVLSKVAKFDVELGLGGPKAMGFGDETLFSKQIQQAGYTIAGALDVAVEHHFDVDRLGRDLLISSAIKLGRTEAFYFHHWDHRISRLPHFRYILLLAKWCGVSLIDRLRKRNQRFVALSTLHIERELAFQRELIVQMRRPRKYDLHGLAPVRE